MVVFPLTYTRVRFECAVIHTWYFSTFCGYTSFSVICPPYFAAQSTTVQTLTQPPYYDGQIAATGLGGGRLSAYPAHCMCSFSHQVHTQQLTHRMEQETSRMLVCLFNINLSLFTGATVSNGVWVALGRAVRLDILTRLAKSNSNRHASKR